MRLCLVCLSLNGLKDSDTDKRTLEKLSKGWVALNCSKSGNSYSSWSSDQILLNDSKIMQDQLHINLEANLHILWRFRKEEDLHKVIPLSLTDWLILPWQWSARWQIAMWWRSATHLTSELAQANFSYSLNWKTHCIHPTSYLGVQHNFWSPIPPCCYIFCEKTRVIMIRICNPC